MPNLYVLTIEQRAIERQTCDLCNAKPGEPCVTYGGHERTIPHAVRQTYAHVPADVRSVGCPTCPAAAGERCTTTSGVVRESAHRARGRAAAMRSA
jgi:hypothetical protein